MAFQEFPELGIKRLSAPTSHNIAAFMESREIDPIAFAKFSGISLPALRQILQPNADPYISDIIRVHRALNKLTDAPLEALLDSQEYVFPDLHDKKNLQGILSLTEKLLETKPALDLSEEYFSDDVEYEKPTVQSFAKKIAEQVNLILENSTAKDPTLVDALIPENVLSKNGYKPLHCIADQVNIGGHKKLADLVRRVGAVPAGQEFKLPNYAPDRIALARKILQPNFDFKLSEMRDIYKNDFRDHGEMVQFSELFNATEERIYHGPESLTALFLTRYMQLSTICKGFMGCPDMRDSSHAGFASRLDQHMSEIMPLWKEVVRSSDYSKKTGEASLSRRELQPIRVGNMDEAFLD